MSRYNVLFLCTGNSARSIMAEAIMNRKGFPNFAAHSAGSHPAGFVQPEALRQIEAAHLSTENLRSKSWDEFSGPEAPRFTSYSQSATKRLVRSAHFGQDSR
jgi:arsenate reductase